jgi:hypothetical protein
MAKPILQIYMHGVGEQKEFIKNFTAGMPEVADWSGEQQAKEIITRAIDRAPIATGYMINSLKWKQFKGEGVGRAIFRIFFGEPVHSRKVTTQFGKTYYTGQVYPLAQDRGYARHRIHTSWIDEHVRPQYQENGEDRWITVSEFHPFLTPAAMEVQGMTKGIINKQINKLFKRAARRSNAYMK